jgi:hypothetical protein
LWSNFVHDLFVLPGVQQDGLLHFYSRNVETEVFDVGRQRLAWMTPAAVFLKFRARELLGAER